MNGDQQYHRVSQCILKSLNLYCIFYIVQFFLVCTFKLYFPYFAFFVTDCSLKQTLLIKRFNFVFIEDQILVSQSNVQAVMAKNEKQYTLGKIRYINFQNFYFEYFEGGTLKIQKNQLKYTGNGVIKEFLDILQTFISQKTFHQLVLTIASF